MTSANKKRYIKGLTTNPSLMRKSGISDYKSFAKLILKSIKNQSHLKYFQTILKKWKNKQIL